MPGTSCIHWELVRTNVATVGGGYCGGLCGPFSTWVCVASTSPEQAKQTECGSFPTLRGGGPLPEGTYLLPWEAWSQATSVTCQMAEVSEQTLSPDLTRC